MNPIATRALQMYVRTLHFFWRPLIALARSVARHPFAYAFGILFFLGVAFGCKTGGVALAESGSVTMGRVLIAAGGVFDLSASVVIALVGALVLYWFLIAVGMVQIPVGEIMEVLRELGQLLRLQDPVKKDQEGNIRAIDSQALLQRGMLLLLVPALALMSSVWLAVFPRWLMYGLLLLVSGVAVVYGLLAMVRGRRIGAGIDLFIGLNGYLLVGSLITVLAMLACQLLVPQWYGAVTDSTSAAPPAIGIDGTLANVWSRFMHGWITWYAPAHGSVAAQWPHAGDVIGVVVSLLLIALFVGLHLATIVALWRILREPPQRERNGSAPTAPSATTITVVGTVGRGDSGWSFAMNGWLWAAVASAIVATIVWLIEGHAHGEWLCRFGDTLFYGPIVIGAVCLAVGLLAQRWPRLMLVLGALTLFGIGIWAIDDTLDHWNGRATACGVRSHATTVASASPVPAASTSDGWGGGSSGSPRSSAGGIAAYFRENGNFCPDAMRRSGFRSVEQARTACESEQWLATYIDYAH